MNCIDYIGTRYVHLSFDEHFRGLYWRGSTVNACTMIIKEFKSHQQLLPQRVMIFHQDFSLPMPGQGLNTHHINCASCLILALVKKNLNLK